MTAPRTYVPLATRLTDFGSGPVRKGGTVRAMGRLLRGGVKDGAEQAHSPLAHALHPLQETGADLPSMPPSASRPAGNPSADVVRGTAASEGEDLAARLAAARADGFAAGLEEGQARARAEAEARIAALEQAHAEELATRERLWADRLAAKLAGRLQEGFRQLARQLEEAVADILAPLMEKAMREQALSELAATLATLADGDMKIKVTGPSTLVEALRERLPARAMEIEVAEDETLADIRVHLADTLIETRLGEWRARLAEAVIAEGTSPAPAGAGKAAGQVVTNGEKAS